MFIQKRQIVRVSLPNSEILTPYNARTYHSWQLRFKYISEYWKEFYLLVHPFAIFENEIHIVNSLNIHNLVKSI